MNIFCILLLFIIQFFFSFVQSSAGLYTINSSLKGRTTLLHIECSKEIAIPTNRSEIKTKRSTGSYNDLSGSINLGQENSIMSLNNLNILDSDIETHYGDMDEYNGRYNTSMMVNNYDHYTDEGISDDERMIREKKVAHNASQDGTSLTPLEATMAPGDSLELPLNNTVIELTHGEIKGTPDVEIESNCGSIKLGEGAIDSGVNDITIKMGGALKLTPNWLQDVTSLNTIKFHTETSLELPTNCSWLPISAKLLDVSHSSIEHLDLSCSESSLQHIVAGLSSSLKSVSLCVPYLESLGVTWSAVDELRITCQRGVEGVTQLNLERNKLISFTTCGWPSLQTLDLNSNNIEFVDLTSCPSQVLVSIDLSTNQLMESPETYPKSLVKLDMSHNRIKMIHPFNSLIQDVDLSHNSLTTFSRGIFKNAWLLLTLDLSHNRLETIYAHSFYGLHDLRTLDLSHNSISHVRHEAFHPMRKLESLNLDHNYLKKLDSRLLSSLPAALELRARHNPWSCSCHLLAKLRHALHIHCEPHCKNMDLFCQEGTSSYTANSILERCIDAVNEIPKDQMPTRKNSIDMPQRYPIHSSDEDHSEEDKYDDENEEVSKWAITGVVLLLMLPIIALTARKMYQKRKKLSRYCECLAPPTSPVLPEWNRVQKEEDESETEM